MNTNSSLLQGERMAHAIVEEARTNRNKRSDESKVEANAEIEVVKNELAERYGAINSQTQVKIKKLEENEVKAREELISITEAFEANKASVKDMLLKHILEVELDLPMVVIGNFDENIKAEE